ncbi:LOW QUALITY PROTEIN: acyl-CoA-binding domain-containing protein 6 [Drosophila nasuta]|uniref:LOW QUALITY PROTEIN: acyl-CoA-binding domain-containing protein 6 n=1 Tax=Drosophila nasuta TaxID=42062 RepID=UPI00295EB50B|nr:LOW QUALITY PROTEIN: acyl-CoA-binding domain-containing protein 6 [Drosophila nasuta]
MSDSDLEMGDDDVEQSELEQQFRLATNHVTAKANVYAAKDLLELYGLYKQATEGVCHTPRPSMLQMQARSKWSAWQALGLMTKPEAQSAYIAKLRSIDEDYEVDSKQKTPGRLNGWVVHSIESVPVEEQSKPEHLKTIFDHVKENNLPRLREQLKPEADLTSLDEQGMALLHWATDRNAIEIIQYLVECGANVNQLDAEQQTPLHYAASCGHVEALRYLLSSNADLELRDADGQTCLDVAEDELICAMLQSALQLRNT